MRKLRATAPQRASKFGASLSLIDDVTGDGRPDVMVGAPDQDVAGLVNAGEAFIYNGANGTSYQGLTSATPQAFAGFGFAFATADSDGDGTPTLVIGVPFQNVDLVEDDDIVTHLQIGQIEIQ